MERAHPLVLTVEQAGEILGIGRSTAYELVRAGELKSIRLRRRIVVPVARIAELLGVDPDAVCQHLGRSVSPISASPAARSEQSDSSVAGASSTGEALKLF